MKYSKILFIFLLGAFCLYSPTVLADRKMPFPDDTAIQPMPTSTLPNISGNIDWPNVAGSASEQSSQNNNPANPNVTNTDNGTNTNGTSVNGTNFFINGDTSNTGAPGSATTPADTSRMNFPSGTSGDGAQSGNVKNNSGTSANSGGFPPAYNFDAFPSQGNTQVQNTSGKNDAATNEAISETSDSSASNQTQKPTQTQTGISKSSYVWALTFGSIILLIVAFILWKLKKSPDDVNQ